MLHRGAWVLPRRRHLPACKGIIAAGVLWGACVPALAQQANQCWSPQALGGRAGEVDVRHNVAQALVAGPSGSLAAVATPAYLRGAVRRVDLPAGAKKIAFTFDLCEQPYEVAGYDGAIVDLLRATQTKATFFAGGKWLLTHQERGQQLIADRLFEIGNHAWEHRNLRLLSGKALEDEIGRVQLAYAKVGGDLARRQCVAPNGNGAVFGQDGGRARPALFRFPFGACNSASLDAVGNAGLLAIQWDVSSGDPTKSLTAARMAADVLARVRSGSIVLFHANGRGWHTAEALELLIPQLRQRGFVFTTVSELLATKGARPVITATCFDSKPGDTDHYDALAVQLEQAYRRFTARFGHASSQQAFPQ